MTRGRENFIEARQSRFDKATGWDGPMKIKLTGKVKNVNILFNQDGRQWEAVHNKGSLWSGWTILKNFVRKVSLQEGKQEG